MHRQKENLQSNDPRRWQRPRRFTSLPVENRAIWNRENRQDVNEKDVKSCQKIQKQTRYLQYVHTTYAPNTMCLVVNKLGTGDSLTCEVWGECREWHLEKRVQERNQREREGVQHDLCITENIYWNTELSLRTTLSYLGIYQRIKIKSMDQVIMPSPRKYATTYKKACISD